MNEFILMTDSTADMPESFYRENQIPVLSLTYTPVSYTHLYFQYYSKRGE